MTSFYFTFGSGYSLSGAHIKIDAPDEDTARRIFVDARGHGRANACTGWSGVYSGDDWDQYQSRWPTVEAPLDAPCTYNYDRDRAVTP